MKKLLLMAVVCLAATNAFSQSFMHGVGVTVMVDKAKDFDARVGFGFTYSPRFNFVETESMSVSVGIPMSAVLSGSYSATYNSRTGWEEDPYGTDDASVGVFFNAPLIVNLNMGAGSTDDNESRFGGFVGAGFGLHVSASTDQVFYDENGNAEYRNTGGTVFGPAANAGMRIGVGNSGKSIEVKLSYFKGLDDNKLNLFGLAGLFNF
ncbi:hypothetical protein [Chitinophaga sp. YIM B06452]|uniref:hypothetical protein n=1 Tax=Chitinophaga sp. YIM B06452 TaxID=3082158 RepID=UPI0031FF183F